MILLSEEETARVTSAMFRALEPLKLEQLDAQLLPEMVERAMIGGKMMRPALVRMSFDALRSPGAPVPDQLWDLAASFELLHAAFVVHDDIIDDDNYRRKTLNVRGFVAQNYRSAGSSLESSIRLGDTAAILVGDLLLYAATRLMFTLSVPTHTRLRLVSAFDEAISRSASGEWADVLAADNLLSQDDPLLISLEKTAIYSFCAPLRAGAALADASEELELEMNEIGRDLGIAFQLVDDLIGTFGSADLAGRAAGADLRERKQTPLIALAKNSEQWLSVQDAVALAHTGPLAVAEAQRELEQAGVRLQVEKIIASRLESARSRAQRLDSSLSDTVAHICTVIEGRIP